MDRRPMQLRPFLAADMIPSLYPIEAQDDPSVKRSLVKRSLVKRSVRVLAAQRRAETVRLLSPLKAGRMAADRLLLSLAQRKDPIIEPISLPSHSTVIVAGYWPIGDEMDMRPLLHYLAHHRITCCLPVIVKPRSQLVFRCWAPGDPLNPNHLGISEPPAISAELKPDILFVPLLAFDRQGFRLGYGGGYYDRSLAAFAAENHPITTIGIAYAAQEIPHVPRELHDRKLDVIVTERELIEISTMKPVLSSSS